MSTPAEMVRSFEVGSCVLVPSPFAFEAEEQLELWVIKVSNGIREFEVRQNGVLMRRLAAKPNKDGSVTWARL